MISRMEIICRHIDRPHWSTNKFQVPLLTFSLTHVSEKNLSSFNSLSVRRQNSVCSKGRIFLMATWRPVGLCVADTTVP